MTLAIKSLSLFELICDYPYIKLVMNKKIEKMVVAYNKYAIKHGYPDSTIQVDYVKKEVIGTFTPRHENTYHGFWGYIKNVIIAGHNGSLRADYDRIVEELKKL